MTRIAAQNLGADSSASGSLEGPDALISRELGSIIPVIAAVMGKELNASSSAFYIYDDTASRTIATFRHEQSTIQFPASSDIDAISPRCIPVEAEILRCPRSIRRSTNADFRRYPLLNDALRHWTSEYSDVVIPLSWQDHVYGVAYLWRHGSADAFSDAEVSIGESLAQVAAMAVEFAREYNDERERRSRLDSLLEVASLAASHLTVDQVMPAVTRIIRSVSEADVCNLYVFDDSGESVLHAFSSGLNEREKWVFEESDRYTVSVVPAEERARRTLQPVVVRDHRSEFAPGSQLIAYAEQQGLSEILVVPIVYQRVMIGVTYLWYRDPSKVFSEEVISTVLAIASQAGGVVSQARLYDAHQKDLRETEALRRIGDSVLNSYSLDEVLDHIVDVLAEMIPYHYAFAGQIDHEQDDVVVKRVWGRFPESLINYRISMESSLTGAAIRSGKLVNSCDALNDARAHRYQPQVLPIQSVLITPLLTENGTIGVLYVGREDRGLYSQRQEQLMTLLAQHAAAAIERTQARAALALYSRRQTFLADVTNTLLTCPDPSDVLQEICELASGVLADGVGVALSSWKYGSISWMGAAHQDPELHSIMVNALTENEISVDRDRVERILAADAPSLIKLDNGAPAEDRELHSSVVDLLNRLGARRMLTVPMRQSGRAPGLLVLLCSNPDTMDDELQQMAQLVANRIGDAIERRQMVKNREALLRLSEAINAHTELEELLELFAEELGGILPYDGLHLGILESGSDELRSLISVGQHGIATEAPALISPGRLAFETVRSRRAFIDNMVYPRELSDYLSRDTVTVEQAPEVSVMAAPLSVENDDIGILLISRSGANQFSDSDFETFLLFSGLAASAIHRTELLRDNQLLYRASVEVLAAVVDAKDPTTLEHSRNVAHYARVIAEAAKLGPSQVERVELAALLHDIGKLSIPDHVLSKPGPLTQQERALINTHPERGANILNQHPALLNLVPLVLHHHERADGSGYPDGLCGEEIPLGASIIAVADAFDTMTSHRTYQRARSIDDALRELRECAGSQFDASLVNLFVNAVHQNPDVVRGTIATVPERQSTNDSSEIAPISSSRASNSGSSLQSMGS